MTQDMGVAATPPGHSDGPASGLAAIAGSVPNADVTAAIKRMTPSAPTALAALPTAPGIWATVSEMRQHGANGANMDLLYISGFGAGGKMLCDRRWTRWGGETGQRRGEGYEYTVTPFGAAVRDALAQAMSAGTVKTPKAVEGQRPASAVAESHAPNPEVQP